MSAVTAGRYPVKVKKIRDVLPRPTDYAPGDALLSNAFFFFFTFQILSPSYFGVTIYLEVIVALLNPRFWVFLFEFRYRRMAVVALTIVLAVMLIVHVANAVNGLATAITVLYLIYAFERGRFYFFRYLFISVGFAVAQWLLLSAGHVAQARNIGPTVIAAKVWGSHATATNTNFYAVIGSVNRVAGLSREAGFFAALITIASCLHLVVSRRNRFRWLVLLVGWLTSVSKISFVVFPMMLAFRLRRSINRIAWPVWFAAFFGVCYWFANHNPSFLFEKGHETWLHRFGGYLIINDLSVHQLFFGTSLSVVNDTAAQAISSSFTTAAGVGGFIAGNGLIALVAYLVFLRSAGANSVAVLLICFATLDVDFTTEQNFVSLAYFVGLYVIPWYDANFSRRSDAQLPEMVKS